MHLVNEFTKNTHKGYFLIFYIFPCLVDFVEKYWNSIESFIFEGYEMIKGSREVGNYQLA